MTSQYAAAPLLIHKDSTSERLQRLPLSGGRNAKSKYDEAWLTKLLFTHPELLPIREIDSVYANPIPVCTELLTRVGLIDVLYVTSSGRLVIAEAKLWRNPEARRKVVGQILDYAAELARWTYSDLEREVAKRRGSGELFSVVAAAAPELDEADFVDNVSRSLRDGRFLLLVCGDGIREEIRGIAEFLRRSTTLDLTFGIVELAIFATSRAERFIQPRVLAKTVTLDRLVVRVENGEGRVEEDIQDELEGRHPNGASARSRCSISGRSLPDRSDSTTPRSSHPSRAFSATFLCACRRHVPG